MSSADLPTSSSSLTLNYNNVQQHQQLQQNLSISSSTASQQSSTGASGGGDTYIFVPVSVRMDGQKMQLDFKVDSKTLAAAEQLRMAVVNGGGGEKLAGKIGGNNNNSCAPMQSGAAQYHHRRMSEFSPASNYVAMETMTSSYQPNSPNAVFFEASYSAPGTPAEECAKSADSKRLHHGKTNKINSARTLLAEKLRKSRSTSTTSASGGNANLNGKKTPGKKKFVAMSTTTEVLQSSPFVDTKPPNLGNFDTKYAVATTYGTPPNCPVSNFDVKPFPAISPLGGAAPLYFDQDVYSRFQHPPIANGDFVVENGHVTTEHYVATDLHTIDVAYNGVVGDHCYQGDGASVVAMATAAPSVEYDVSEFFVQTSTTTRDTVESICDAVVASCRRDLSLVDSAANCSSTAATSSPTVISNLKTNNNNVDTTVVTTSVTTSQHKSSKSKSTPSAMCGFVNVNDEQKQCRQRCINGYKFCIRHILNDSSAPYRACAYVKVQGAKRINCNNAVPQKQGNEYCGTHMIMMGMRVAKTKKPKTASVESSNNKSLPLPMPPTLNDEDEYYQHLDAQVYNNNVNTPSISNTADNNVSDAQSFMMTSSQQPTIAPDSLIGRSDDNLSSTMVVGGVGDNNYYNNYSNTSQMQMDLIGGHQQQQDVIYNGYSSSQYSANNNNPGNLMFQQQNSSFGGCATQRSSSTLSRSDSQMSVMSSPYLNGYGSGNNLHSPQSPWKMPSTPTNGGGNFVYVSSSSSSQTTGVGISVMSASTSDIARNHPELMSKLNITPTASGQSLRQFANVVTSAMFEDSNSCYTPSAGGPFQAQHQQPQQRQQRYSYSNPGGNPLMFGEDPFLCPPIQQQLQAPQCVETSPAVLNFNVMPSPVPSDLSVESVGSHVSASTFQMTPSNVGVGVAHHHRHSSPTPLLSGFCQTPSPVGLTCGVGGHVTIGATPHAASPTVSRCSSTFSSNPLISSQQHGVAQQQQHLFHGSQSLSAAGGNVVGLFDAGDRLESPGRFYSSKQQQQPPQDFVMKHVASFDTQVFESSSSAVINNQQLVTTSDKQQQQSSATKMSNFQTGSVAATSTLLAPPGVVVAVAPVVKPKKVIRLKPKKRRMKMMGKYRQIPAVVQMCRVMEDLHYFDRTDLFPLGLEPSSSDSEDEDDIEPFLPLAQTTVHDISYETDDHVTCANEYLSGSSLTANVVSAARRQLYMLKRSLSFSNKELRKQNLETKFIGLASRNYPNSVGSALSDLRTSSRRPAAKSKEKGREKPLKKLSNVGADVLNRKCGYNCVAGDSQVTKCGHACLPYATTCLSHILHVVDQQLFRYCATDNAAAGCHMPSLDVGLSDVPKCPAHQDRVLYRALGNIKLEPDDQLNNSKKKYKTRYILKKHRRRRKKNAPQTSFDSTTGRIMPDAQDGNNATEATDDDESEKEEDSNQEAQAALDSVARDFGFRTHDLTDILVRLPDATLIENILGQEFTRPSEPAVTSSSSSANKEEIDPIDRALTATASDHNWADVEQFLMEENYKSAGTSSSVSPPEYTLLTCGSNSSEAAGTSGHMGHNFSASWPSPTSAATAHDARLLLNGVVAPPGGGLTSTVRMLATARTLPVAQPVVGGGNGPPQTYVNVYSSSKQPNTGDLALGQQQVRLPVGQHPQAVVLRNNNNVTITNVSPMRRW